MNRPVLISLIFYIILIFCIILYLVHLSIVFQPINEQTENFAYLNSNNTKYNTTFFSISSSKTTKLHLITENLNSNNQKFKCGQVSIRSKRIINGYNAANGSWPWEVKIMYIFSSRQKNEEKLIGSGSIIHQNYILTSISLLKDLNQTQIMIQIHNIKYDIIKLIKHPEFSFKNFTFTPNIALLKTYKLIRFTDYISPVCLPKLELNNLNDKYVYITGWGMINKPFFSFIPNNLQETKLNILNNSDNRCKKYVSYNKNIYYCVLDINTKRKSNACHGDSNMYLKINHAWFLYGILSFLSSTDMICYPKHPSYFLKIVKYSKWIQNEIEFND